MAEEKRVLIEEVYAVEKKTDASERVAIHALQKQLQILDYKEWLLMFGFIFGAAMLRVPMQAVPSAEPITFFAILAGWLFGWKKGFFVGVSSLYVSNFVTMGGQGVWTIFQALGFGVIGFLGGFLRKKSTIFETLTIVTAGTVIYEIIVNIGSIMFFPIGIIGIFISALPFSITHIVSNVIFASFLPKTKEVIEKKGGFDEREMCQELMGKFNNKIEGNGFFMKIKQFLKKMRIKQN